MIGKIGRDIEENKCSWLVVQALLRATPAQRALIDKHYGIDNPSDVAIIKKVYLDIGIPDVSTHNPLLSIFKVAKWNRGSCGTRKRGGRTKKL